MALFPAYSEDNVGISEAKMLVIDECEVSPAGEARLLASDTDEESPPPRRDRAEPRAGTHADTRADLASAHYYIDNKFDPGNLRVSTLYYPGRPEYKVDGKVVGKKRKREARRERAPRYWERRLEPTDAPAHHAEVAARLRALADQLHARPADHRLWLHYIHLQEVWRGGEAALQAAERAVREYAGAGAEGARRVRAALHRARLAHLDPHSLLRALQHDADAASSQEDRLEAWIRLVETAWERGGTAEGDRALRGALRGLPHAHYPRLLYIYGSYLCSAGLWEQLVLLVELVVAMNLPRAGFPPPADALRDAAVENKLVDYEDKVLSSGMPLHVQWARVERARAAAHWRPAPASAPSAPSAPALEADPQRYPVPGDVADLLLPVTDPRDLFLLCVHLLRLAKVPVLPMSQYVTEAVCGAEGGAACAGPAECVLGALRAARRAAGVRRPSAPAAAGLLRLLVDPPHYLSDEAGYRSWVCALWEAVLGAHSASAPRRLALLCWRLRWLHALALLHDEKSEERASLMREGRAAVAAWGGGDPLPCVLLARLDPPRYMRRALAAVLAHRAAAPAHRLYAARLAAEQGAGAGAGAGDAREALCEAVLRRPVTAPVDNHTIQLAYQQCVERCTQLEQEWLQEVEAGRGSGEGPGDLVCAALGVHEGSEWGAARVRLAAPAQRRDILRDILHYSALTDKSASFSRYCEQVSCALVGTGGGAGAAARLAPHYPHSQYLQASAAGAWSREPRVSSPAAGLARALPALLAAVSAQWAAGEAERARAACGAGQGAGEHAALPVCRVEAAARGGRAGAVQRALLAALDRLPNYKWLYVRGAAWSGAGAGAVAGAGADALQDAALHRGLRLHTLLAELEHNTI